MIKLKLLNAIIYNSKWGSINKVVGTLIYVADIDLHLLSNLNTMFNEIKESIRDEINDQITTS